MFKSAVFSAATLLSLATAARIPTKVVEQPKETADAVPKDPTEGLDGGKVEKFLAELDKETPGTTLAAMTAGCDRITLTVAQRIPQFINHINPACFATVLKTNDKAAHNMLMKVETAEAAEEVYGRLGASVDTIDETKLAAISTVLHQRVQKGKTEAKAEPQKGSASVSAQSSAALIAVAGLCMLL